MFVCLFCFLAALCSMQDPRSLKVKALVVQSCQTLCDPMNCIAHQAPLSMGFSRQEYWSGLPCPVPGDHSDPGIKPGPPTLQADSLPSEPPRKPPLSSLTRNQTCTSYSGAWSPNPWISRDVQHLYFSIAQLDH